MAKIKAKKIKIKVKADSSDKSKARDKREGIKRESEILDKVASLLGNIKSDKESLDNYDLYKEKGIIDLVGLVYQTLKKDYLSIMEVCPEEAFKAGVFTALDALVATKRIEIL